LSTSIKRRGAAIHDRDFRTIDLDHRVVDAEAGKRRQHMLGCRAQRPAVVAQHGGKLSCGHGAHIGTDLAVGAAIEASAQENDAGVGVSGMQREGRRQARMDTDASDRCIDAQCRLLADFHATVPLEIAAARNAARNIPPRAVGGSPFRHELRKTSRDRHRIPPAIPPTENPLLEKNLRQMGQSRQLTLFYRLLPLIVPF
jgi:hypothetical protein